MQWITGILWVLIMRIHHICKNIFCIFESFSHLQVGAFKGSSKRVLQSFAFLVHIGDKFLLAA